MIKYPVVLPILHLTDENKHLQELGIYVPDSDCTSEDMMFFNISAVGPSSYAGCCVLYVPGENFVCSMTLKDAQDSIMEQGYLISNKKIPNQDFKDTSFP